MNTATHNAQTAPQLESSDLPYACLGDTAPAESDTKLPALTPHWIVTCNMLANLGFYSVIPFLAGHLSAQLGMSAVAIGIILGVRTASQQGLFVVGGTLADAFGPRALGVAGCAVRVFGFLMLGFATQLPGVIAGAILTGLGGALFSPSLESTMSHACTSTRSRREWFARLAAFSEIGALLGPAGVGFLGHFSFATVCEISALLFVGIGLLMFFTLPRRVHEQRGIFSLSAALKNRRFLLFAALFGAQLFAYNQLYFLLPLEASATSTHPEATTALLFMCASLLIAIAQIPASRLVKNLPLSTVIPLGFAALAAAFTMPVLGHAISLAPNLRIITTGLVLVVGHMLVAPTALSAIGDFAGNNPTGAFHGLLATCGGIAVLLGNAATGFISGSGGETAAVPEHTWWLIAAVLVAAGITLHFVLRSTHEGANDSRVASA